MMRSCLYWLAKLLRDVNAVQKGKVEKRIGRRVVGRVAGKGIGKMFR